MARCTFEVWKQLGWEDPLRMQFYGFDPFCENEGTHCAPCFCTGPCYHEANLVCAEHNTWMEGYNQGSWPLHTLRHQQEDPTYQEGDCDICHLAENAAYEYVRVERKRVIYMDGPFLDLMATYGLE